MYRQVFILTTMLLCTVYGKAQQFSLEKQSDSLSYVVLKTGKEVSRWRLDFPVYQFCTGDVNGDGVDEAIVGVVKPTRFHPEPARRIFIFKNHRGHVRPMWLGSKLGGRLVDFRLKDGRVFSIENAPDGSCFVAEYRWEGFGLKFVDYLIRGVNEQQAYLTFNF